MKLVKEIATNKYLAIDQATYDADPSLYVDRSDRPAYWLRHYADAGFTYMQSRWYIRELVDNAPGDVDDFNTADKDALITYFYGDKTKLVTHIVITQGKTVPEAAMMLETAGAINFAALAKDAKNVVASPRMMQIGMHYLTWTTEGQTDSTQADNFISAIQDFLGLYTTRGLLGITYTDDREGIMDYIESTNSYVGGGLENYTISPDIVAAVGSEENARALLIAELQDLFVKGNV